MLPSLDTSTANANPRFEALYNDLCRNRLDFDATSILDVDALRQRKTFESELLEARLAAARRTAITSALKELAFNSTPLPEELRELIIIAQLELSGQLVGEDLEAAEDARQDFRTRLPDLASTLSAHIRSESEKLDRLVAASASNLSTEETIKLWRATIDRAAASTAELDTESTATVRRIHETSQQLVEHCIRTLEQTHHGSVSRAVRAKADYLAIVAEGMSKKLDVQYSQLLVQLDSGKVRDVFQTRNQELSKQNKALTRQLRARNDTLDELKADLKHDQRVAEYLRLSRLLRDAEQR